MAALRELGEALGIRLEKLTIEQKSTPVNRVRVMYNPQSLNLKTSVVYEPGSALGDTAETLIFKNVTYSDLVLELILDASRPGMRDSVTSQLAQIRQVCLPLADVSGRYVAPLLKISWGRMDWLGEPYCVAYAISTDVNYTLFDRSGRPMRATVKLELKVQPPTGAPRIRNGGGQAKQAINNLRDKLGF